MEKGLIDIGVLLEPIAYRPLYPELSANSVLAWKKQQPFSLAATKFIEQIKCFSGRI